jgi:hypothetical protein
MSKQIKVLLLVTLLFTAGANALCAQEQQTTTASPTRPESEILKTIVFITVELKEPDQPSGSLRPTPPPNHHYLYGTGFLIGVTDKRLKDRIFTYIVTNRHVAAAIEPDQKGHCTSLRIQKTLVTLNLKERVNGKRADPVDITDSPQRHWYFPENEATDLAIMPFGIDSKYDTRLIGLDQLLTTETLDKQHVVPGDRVLTGGFFYGYAGLHEIQPILREGVLAMLPDGPMTTTTCKSGDL